MCPTRRQKQSGRRSCGKLLPNVEAKIVDVETGKEIAPGEGEGELWFRGPNIFPGYLNRPELQKDTFSEDGFFKTGDIGYCDKKGNFYITDRLKELIKYSKCGLFTFLSSVFARAIANVL